jgi:hypothetical protein
MKRVLGRDLDSIAPHFDHNPEPEADISRHANPLAAVGWWPVVVITFRSLSSCEEFLHIRGATQLATRW